MNHTASSHRPSDANLRRLVLLRYVVVLLVVGALGVAHTWLEVDVFLAPVAVAMIVLVAVNLATHLRLRASWPVTGPEFFAHLTTEVVLLTVVLYFSGGSTNPLVSLYLLPLTVAATVLTRGYAWAMSAIAVACYTVLLFWYVPLGEEHHAHGAGLGGSDFSVHVAGMWITFVVSAGLISHFVTSMAQSLRDRDHQLAMAREEALRNERIVALGTLAAGAAHELGTPLATMAVLAEDMQRRYTGQPELHEDLADLEEQIANCKRIISGMAEAAGAARGISGRAQPADEFLDDVLTKWELMRPTALFRYRWDGGRPAPAMVAEQTVSQAVINLVNNAADASPDSVEIVGRCEGEQVLIDILDRGPGLTPEVQRRAGEPFFTTKKAGKGMGIGLFLANATIERFGGRVRMFNREGGGACTQVALPVMSLPARSEA